MMKGIVISSRYGVFEVDTASTILEVKARGLFRHQKKKIIVGDYVTVDEETLTIVEVEDRKNELIRPAIANVDRAYVVMSYLEPDFSPYLVMKFFTYLNYHQITPSLIVTKMDRCQNREAMEKWKDLLKGLGYSTFFLSTKQEEDIQALKEDIQGKTCLFLGQSGVGKSSLLNTIFPKWDLKIGSYSSSLGRGRHQTKEVLLLPYEGGYLADTPGFSSLELELTMQEIQENFPGFKPYIGHCFFKDCIHVHEKKCALKEAVEKEQYPQVLYDLYLELTKEITEDRRKLR